MTLQEDIDGLNDRIKTEWDTIYASQRYIKSLLAEKKTLVKELRKQLKAGAP
jgi:hypothetical protein